MTDRACAYCYAVGRPLKLCGRCHKRAFCSRECQKADWKHSHKRFCGRTCELGVDLEIKPSIDKGGLGMFALLPIARDQIVFVERPLLLSVLGFRGLSVQEQTAVQALLPHGGTVQEKFEDNAIACSTDGSEGGLFVNLSRINHECIGNTTHHYLPQHDVKILVSSQPIAPGEEITFSYCGDGDAENRRDKLRATFGFECRCRACLDPDIDSKLVRVQAIDASMWRLCQTAATVPEALRCGDTLIRLYDELSFSSKFYSRTYYDMFQAAVTKRSTLSRAAGLAKLAAEHCEKFYGADYEDVARFRSYAADPTSHRNYLVFG